MIHIFRADRNYELVGTMDDHSSSIFDICFVKSEGQERLLSCAADKATIFRTLNSNTFSRYTQNIQKIKKCYQVKSHPIHKTVVTGEDKAVKVWDLITGKCNSTYEDYNDRGVKV